MKAFENFCCHLSLHVLCPLTTQPHSFPLSLSLFFLLFWIISDVCQYCAPIVTIWWARADRRLFGAVKYCVARQAVEPEPAGSVVQTDSYIVRVKEEKLLRKGRERTQTERPDPGRKADWTWCRGRLRTDPLPPSIPTISATHLPPPSPLHSSRLGPPWPNQREGHQTYGRRLKEEREKALVCLRPRGTAHNKPEQRPRFYNSLWETMEQPQSQRIGHGNIYYLAIINNQLLKWKVYNMQNNVWLKNKDINIIHHNFMLLNISYLCLQFKWKMIKNI